MLNPSRGLRLPRTQSICFQCLSRLSGTASGGARWSSAAAVTLGPRRRTLQSSLVLREYFSANGQLPNRARDLSIHKRAEFFRGARPASVAAHAKDIDRAYASDTARDAARRYRDLDRDQDKVERKQDITKGPSAPDTTASAKPYTIPPDASSRLSSRAGKLPPASFRRLMTSYLALSKPRLTFLMVLTAASAYSLYPVPTILSSATTESPSLSALTLVFLTSGTALCSAAANALNMLLEPEHDAKMSRTRNRPLVRGLIGRRGALVFAAITSLVGVAGLYYGVNPTVSFLGAFNIVLYAGVYTPLKRVSVVNTWVGAVVGAIPPLMGWAAAAGHYATGAGRWPELLLGADAAGGWLLAALLYAWQFPHFNALSWTIRDEYRAAGYRMLAWVDPRANARIALRYAVLFFPLCAGLTAAGVTDRGFLVSSSLVNAWLVREAWRFWRFQGHHGSARALFWAGVWQLPGLLVLAMFHKQGLWDGVSHWLLGGGDPAGELDWMDDEEPAPMRRVKAS